MNQEKATQHVERIVSDVYQHLFQKASEEFRAILNSVPIRVLWDSPEHDRYGDFFGVPLDEGDGSSMPPADIILYAKPLLEQFRDSEEDLIIHVKKTLMHEIGHYLGLDHEELRMRGWD